MPNTRRDRPGAPAQQQAEPQPQPQPAGSMPKIAAQPTPVTWTFGEASTPDRSVVFSHVEINTVVGTIEIFLIPADMIRLGQQAIECGTKSSSGLFTPSTPQLIVPGP